MCLHGVSGAVQWPWGLVTLLSAIYRRVRRILAALRTVPLLSAIIGVFGNVIGVHNVVDCETSVGQFLAGVFSQEGDQFSCLHHSGQNWPCLFVERLELSW